ncbi:MAG: hypothetical protein JXR21_01135 [Candidatus Marinimicrobia bacterium]|nr:hypothetical protein [Candidatus Neomarinimicrobiota bacterium]
MKKYFLTAICLASLAFAQMSTPEYHFLDIRSALIPGNPALLTVGEIPCDFVFSYLNDREGGDYRLPFTPEGKNYYGTSATAYKAMANGAVFAGRFAYRYERRINKLWLHNAENHLNIPLYFADSTSGDFELNGIDWNILFSYPLGEHVRAGVDVFYNVDEQFKTVFPMPNIKRNDLNIRPAIAFLNERSQLGITGSFFSYIEDMNTKKYVLEQGRTPVFLRIRGLDRPLVTRAETSEERLQNIRGYAAALNFDLRGRLLFDSNIERSSARVFDGGTERVPQGSWDMTRLYCRVDLRRDITRTFGSGVFYRLYLNTAEAMHPTLGRRMYGYAERLFEAGLVLPYRSDAGESWTGSVSGSFADMLFEDNFLGLLHYFPGYTLHMNMQYRYSRRDVTYSFEMGYDEDIGSHTDIIYDDLADWYYELITRREIAYYSQNLRQLHLSLSVRFPFREQAVEVRGSYTGIIPKNSETRYRLSQLGVAYIF